MGVGVKQEENVEFQNFQEIVEKSTLLVVSGGGEHDGAVESPLKIEK